MECAALMVHCVLFPARPRLRVRWPSGEAEAAPHGQRPQWRLQHGGKSQLVDEKTLGEFLKQLLLLWPKQTEIGADWAAALAELAEADRPSHTLHSFLAALKKHHVLELCETQVPNTCLE
jgi:hypothetical protein